MKKRWRNALVVLVGGLFIAPLTPSPALAACQDVGTGSSERGAEIDVCVDQYPGNTVAVGTSINVWSGQWEVIGFADVSNSQSLEAFFASRGSAMVCTQTINPFPPLNTFTCVAESWPIET